MKIVRVTYTTKEEYSSKNKLNIQNVMNDLMNNNYPGINYNACINSDGTTFTHTAFFNSDEDQKILNDLPSFKVFQEQLKAEGLLSPPKQELIELVGTSKNIF